MNLSPFTNKSGYIPPGYHGWGIPALRWVDGPGGIDNRYDTVSLPQPIALAATFDRQLAYAYGSVQGLETRATGMDVFLGPMVNIARLPNWRRNVTSQGEDPYLDAEITSPQVKAIQAQGVIASVKHLIAYNQTRGVDSNQHQKPGDDFIVDERTLHEIELPAFEAAVKAGTGSVMAAYSKLNGYQNADNPDTLQHILRGELTGLQGPGRIRLGCKSQYGIDSPRARCRVHWQWGGCTAEELFRSRAASRHRFRQGAAGGAGTVRSAMY